MSTTSNRSDQLDELVAIESIFPGCLTYQANGKLENDDRNAQPTEITGEFQVELPRSACPISLCGALKNGSVRTSSVYFLSPILLKFSLPDSYPSASAPDFSLCSDWLTDEGTATLRARLIEVYKENAGCPVFYIWIQTIQDEAYGLLGSDRIVNVESIEADDNHFARLTAWNEKAAVREFAEGSYSCAVCCMEKSGRDCVRYLPCSHVFCVDCVKQFYQTKLQDSTVKALECMDDDCHSLASESTLRQVLTGEQFDRYDRLLLTNALDLLDDVIACPRTFCQAPVVYESSSNLANCTSCDFSFCTICRKTNHGVEPCKLDSANLLQLIEQWDAASPADREHFAKRFGGIKKLERIVNDARAVHWIESHSKPCPKCRSSIERQSGCNKMHCARCQVHFCWLCMRILDRNNPYAHYNADGGTCMERLFEDTVMSDEEEDNWSEGEND